MAKAAQKTKSSKTPRRAARKERAATSKAKRGRVEEAETLPLFGDESLKPAAGKKSKASSAAVVAEPAAVEVVSESPRARRGSASKASYSSAETIGQKQREISVSEFFAKNRHMLGFDSPTRALLTAVKEAVDNSLDACEEAGLAPDIVVEIHELAEDRYKLIVEDSGPGIVKAQVPKIFGKLLYGSKFHELRQSRGQQGIGISAAVMYSQLTTGKSVKITSRTGAKSKAHLYELQIDTKKNAAHRAGRRPRRMGAPARHAHRDGTRGRVSERQALGRPVPAPSRTGQSARRHSLHRTQVRSGPLRALEQRTCRRPRSPSNRTRTASSWVC